MSRSDGKHRDHNSTVPELKWGKTMWEEVMSNYARMSAVVIRGFDSSLRAFGGGRGWEDLGPLKSLFRKDPRSVRASWNGESRASLSPEQVFGPPTGTTTSSGRTGERGGDEKKNQNLEEHASTSSDPTADFSPNRWYASFLIQEGSPLLQDALDCLPVKVPKPLNAVHHTQCVWFFFGNNQLQDPTVSTTAMMVGKDEHVDEVSNDGTWHLQTSGQKVWYIRPNPSADWPQGQVPPISTAVEIKVDTGDLIIINTRRWFHKTAIPPHPRGVPSVSYARDFFLIRPSDASVDNSTSGPSLNMANQMGSWATTDIQEGQTIFTESPAFFLPLNPESFRCCSTCGNAVGTPTQHLRDISRQVQEINRAENNNSENSSVSRGTEIPGLPVLPDFPIRGADGATTTSPWCFCSQSCRRFETAWRFLETSRDFQIFVEAAQALVPDPEGVGITLRLAGKVLAGASVSAEGDENAARSAAEAIAQLSESGHAWEDMVSIEHDDPSLSKPLHLLSTQAWEVLSRHYPGIPRRVFQGVLAAIHEKRMQIDSGTVPSLLERYITHLAEIITPPTNHHVDTSSLRACVRSFQTALRGGTVSPDISSLDDLDRKQLTSLLPDLQTELENFGMLGAGIYPQLSRVRIDRNANCQVLYNYYDPTATVVI
ncbi:hypothetical protein AAMO2058_000467800 [Amorphochlora amoebiformis]